MKHTSSNSCPDCLFRGRSDWLAWWSTVHWRRRSSFAPLTCLSQRVLHVFENYSQTAQYQPTRWCYSFHFWNFLRVRHLRGRFQSSCWSCLFGRIACPISYAHCPPSRQGRLVSGFHCCWGWHSLCFQTSASSPASTTQSTNASVSGDSNSRVSHPGRKWCYTRCCAYWSSSRVILYFREWETSSAATHSICNCFGSLWKGFQKLIIYHRFKTLLLPYERLSTPYYYHCHIGGRI